ncbi:MAG TPA: type I DNA topoisomerase [Sphaerochaeta sp.]|nr:type I DNA topoisomerase [Sphaerochaeta sp.]
MSEEKILIVVESPTKARTIKRFLPKNCTVVASKGHVRDLPEDRMAIDTEQEFACEYQVVPGRESVIKELKTDLKKADRLLLATDEDREGESISWHLVELLKPTVPYQRMVFHEITKGAITKALEQGRDLDENLVHAQESRRIVDRLYGYTLSPTLWRKLSNKKLSAGRVQSVGLRLIVERERQRLQFSESSYYDAEAQLRTAADAPFEAKLIAYQGAPLAASKDFDSITGAYKGKKGTLLLQKEEAEAIVKAVEAEPFIVEEITRRPFVTRPSIPFTTSTLQMDAIRRLRISAAETMRIAQKLYENGFITYMRTDSPSLSQEGTRAARAQVTSLYGKEYLSEKPRYFAARSASAQEAHEAIRPAGEHFRKPEETGLKGREFALYDLIYKRTIACQMAEAKKATTTARIRAGEAEFTASGTEIVFPGFIRAYVEGSDDPEAALEDKEKLLPAMEQGEKSTLESLEAVEHRTKSPARYTEASLVRELEKRGIGRPSTYASIIKTLLDRQYAIKQGNALAPTFIGYGVCQFLETNFAQFIDYDFTSMMEDGLDKIAAGELDKVAFLNAFYHGDAGLREQNEQQLELDNRVASKTLKLCKISDDNPVMIGPYGPYVIDPKGDFISVPHDWIPGNIEDSDVKALIEAGKQERKEIILGAGPNTGEDVQLLDGRYGPYWQEGSGKKAKRASVPKWVLDAELAEDLETASQYLSLPRVLGTDEAGEEVIANKGKYGPYIAAGKQTRKLPQSTRDELVFSITLEEALKRIAEPVATKGKGRGSRAAVIQEIGPYKKETIALADGRYGLYLKVGKKNVSLPKEYKEDLERAKGLTVEEAVAIIEAKKQKG